MRVNAVVECDEAASDGWEQVVGVLTELNVVPAKPREVLHQNYIDTTGLCVCNKTLNTRALKIRPGVAVVDIGVDLVPAPFPDISLQQELLRCIV